MKASTDTQLARLFQEKEALLGRLREVEDRIKRTQQKKEGEGERTIRTRALVLGSYGRAEEGEVREAFKGGASVEELSKHFGISQARVRKIVGA